MIIPSALVRHVLGCPRYLWQRLSVSESSTSCSRHWRPLSTGHCRAPQPGPRHRERARSAATDVVARRPPAPAGPRGQRPRPLGQGRAGAHMPAGAVDADSWAPLNLGCRNVGAWLSTSRARDSHEVRHPRMTEGRPGHLKRGLAQRNLPTFQTSSPPLGLTIVAPHPLSQVRGAAPHGRAQTRRHLLPTGRVSFVSLCTGAAKPCGLMYYFPTTIPHPRRRRPAEPHKAPHLLGQPRGSFGVLRAPTPK